MSRWRAARGLPRRPAYVHEFRNSRTQSQAIRGYGPPVAGTTLHGMMGS